MLALVMFTFNENFPFSTAPLDARLADYTIHDMYADRLNINCDTKTANVYSLDVET